MGWSQDNTTTWCNKSAFCSLLYWWSLMSVCLIPRVVQNKLNTYITAVIKLSRVGSSFMIKTYGHHSLKDFAISALNCSSFFFSNLINKSLILMYHLNVGDLCIPKITSTTSKVLIGVINSGPLLSYALNDEIFPILFCSSISAGIDRSRTVTWHAHKIIVKMR